MAERVKEAEEPKAASWFTGAAKTPKAKPRTVDEDEWSRFPAKKHKALCNLRHPALARRRHPALARRRASMPINDTPINDIELLIRLAALKSNGWQAVNVGGDGNCFFRALAKQVYFDEQEHGRARQETIQYMRERREDFEHFVPKDFDSYDSNVNHMSREGTYIEGQFEIQAAADAFNVHIMVYGRSRDHDRTFTPLMSNLETRDVYMAHYQAAQHYVVLERILRLRGPSSSHLGTNNANDALGDAFNTAGQAHETPRSRSRSLALMPTERGLSA
jgi:hypothetical protein